MQLLLRLCQNKKGIPKESLTAMVKSIRLYMISTLYLAPIMGVDIFDYGFLQQKEKKHNLLALV